MASGATKMAVIGNMLMDVRAIDINERNLEVRSDTRAHLIVARSSIVPLPSCYGCLFRPQLLTVQTFSV